MESCAGATTLRLFLYITLPHKFILGLVLQSIAANPHAAGLPWAPPTKVYFTDASDVDGWTSAHGHQLPALVYLGQAHSAFQEMFGRPGTQQQSQGTT